MQGYVVGLMFRNKRSEVALIHKKRPHWQAGKMNGIGGKVGDTVAGEHPAAAMEREFMEETGFTAPYWVHFCDTPWNGGYVAYFLCECEDATLASITDEEVDWVKVADLPRLDVVPNIRWVVPLALSYFDKPFFATVDYAHDPALSR